MSASIDASRAARIPSGTFWELGPLNWAIARAGARAIRSPRFALMEVLGQHRWLFLFWAPFSAFLLGFGRLSRKDVEVVILRVGHLRRCEYELQQHRRLAKKRGIDAATQARIFEGPDAEGLTDRQRVLITATDEFVTHRSLSTETWAAMARHFERRQLIEFCMLAAQYDGLAATIETLQIPLDFPD